MQQEIQGQHWVRFQHGSVTAFGTLVGDRIHEYRGSMFGVLDELLNELGPPMLAAQEEPQRTSLELAGRVGPDFLFGADAPLRVFQLFGSAHP